MPEKEATPLRIFCLCGQKMRVAGNMYGRAAKCIGCGLKISIPAREDIPSGTTELHIKDNPDLIRKRPPARPLPNVQNARAKPDKTPEKAESIPLDPLEALSWLCSLEWKLKREIRRTDTQERGTLARLQEQRTRIKEVRAAFEEDMRQRLMEVAIELASTYEKLAEYNLETRVGELPFAEFRSRAERLRRRRDCLEQRQANLRAWLATRDPYLAGGYVDIPFDKLTEDILRLTFHDEPHDVVSLLEWVIEGLRDDLAQAQEAEHRLAQLSRITDEPGLSDSRIVDTRAENEAVLKRSKTKVEFWRSRLEQLKKDYTNDLEAIDAQMELARGRRQVGEIDRAQFESTSQDLLRAKTDIAKASDVLTRALTANTTQDVPSLRGTFLTRLAPSVEEKAEPLCKWLAWSSLPLLVASLFLPAVGRLSPFTAVIRLHETTPATLWLMIAPILAMALVAALTALRNTTPRGLGLLSVCTAFSLAATLFFHEASYGFGDLGEQIRTGGPWPLRPGGIAFCLAMITIACAGTLALLAHDTKARLAPPIAAIVVLLAIITIKTDILGLFAPAPPVTSIIHEPLQNLPGQYDTTITLANASRRTIRVSAKPKSRTEFGFHLQHQIGQNSWREMTDPSKITIDEQTESTNGKQFSSVSVAANSEAVLTYRLAAGNYRVQIQSAGRGDAYEEGFSLESPTDNAESSGENTSPAQHGLGDDQAPETEAADDNQVGPGNGETDEPETTDKTENDESVIMVELRGIVATEGRDPLFSILLNLPGAEEKQRTLEIGGKVFGEWRLGEYNPAEQTVTLTDGQRLLVLRSGEPQKLEAL